MLYPNTRDVPERQSTNPKSVYSKFHNLQDTGTLPGVRVTVEREINHDIDDEEKTVHLKYCVWERMKETIYSVKAGTRDALLNRILDATDCIRKIQWKMQQPTCPVDNRGARYMVISICFIPNHPA